MKLCLDLPNVILIIGNWLYNWQTLISGMLALVAALWAGCNLNRQIRQTAKLADQQLQRQHKAARATLSLTLSVLVQVVEQLLLDLRRARKELLNGQEVREFSPPTLPADTIPELQQIILSTDNPSVTEPISEIIRQMQTLWSRVSIAPDPDPNIHNCNPMNGIKDWLIQAAQVHALVESLFEYARGNSQDGPTSVAWERAESILIRLYIYDKDLKEIVESGRVKSSNFWTLP